MSGELTGFAPLVPLQTASEVRADFAEVAIIDPQPPAQMLPPPVTADLVGRIGIELASGICLTVDTGVDAGALARVLSVIGR